MFLLVFWFRDMYRAMGLFAMNAAATTYFGVQFYSDVHIKPLARRGVNAVSSEKGGI